MVIFEPPLYHPTVMLRASWLRGAGLKYDPNSRHAEDYHLWEKAVRQTVVSNVGEVLVRYRRHGGQVSQRHAGEQRARTRDVRLRQIVALGLQPSPDDLDLHDYIAVQGLQTDVQSLRRVRAWLEELAAANRSARRYPEPAFSRLLAERMYRISSASTAVSLPGVCTVFGGSPLAASLRPVPASLARLVAVRLIPSRVLRASMLLRGAARARLRIPS
jgi:hypothetical protein